MNSMLPHSDKPLLSEGWSWLWIIFVTLAVLMSGIHLADAAPLSKPQQLTSPDQVPEGLAKSDWSSIRAAYEAGRHQFFKQDDGSHVASNPGLGWKMEFDERGFTAKPNDGGWEWGLELQRDADTPVCTSASEGEKSPSNTLQRRLTPAITEWFINDRRGLEQGWTLSAPAEIRLRVRGNLKPTVSPQSVRFGDQITYSGLKAWDATGKTILTHFEATEEGFAVRYDDAGAQYPLTIDPIAQQAYLKPAAIGTTQAGDNFGGSVAISGDTVVVGALYEDGNFTGVNSAVNDGTSDYGAAYVFVRSGATWSQQAYLKASQVTAGDQFGYSVAISGDTVVVGSLFEDGSTAGVNGTVNESASNSGAAYVFVRNGTTWSQQAYLKASQVTGNDQFGYSVAVSGETVVIGAPFENGSAAGVNGTVDEGAADAGAAFVFVRNGTVWSQQAYLKASEVTTLDFFGRSVAVAGDTVVVGANGEDGSSPGVNGAVDEAASAAGAAYVFVRNGTTWTQEAYLKASQVNDSDAFGVAVAVSSDTIVVGSPGEDSSATGINQMIDEGALGAGAAYVFVRTGTIWSQQAYLKPAAVGTTQAGDDFGRSVAVDGDTVVVGASLEDGGIPGVNGTPNQSRDSSGAAYVFTRGGTTWVQQAYLKASQVSSSDQFGAAVAIAGGTVVVGALGEDGSATGVNGTENESAADAGAAYVFTGLGPAPEIAVEHPAATNLVDGGATIDFGTSALAATGVTKTFTIRNLGILDLTGLSVMKSGLNASEFVINTTGMSTTLAYGVSTTFSVTFTPSLLGNRSAVLQITSNDDDETPFDISLSGVGTGSGAQAISFSSASDIPITANGLTATGSTLDFTLNFAPATGANLTVVNNTSLNFINGTFSNLAQGQVVNLSYGGVVYPYVANYHGGTGNDLVFVWKNNRAYAWGNNSSNQLGVSVATPLGYLTQPTPVDATGVLAGKTILSLAGGPEWTIALCSDGTLAAWGKNDYGQLGINSVVSPQPLPVLVNTTQGISALYGKSVIAIAASSAYSCLALCSDGTIASWGRNSQGQLGNGSTNDSTVPVAVRTTGSALSGKTVVAIASGTAHSLALCSDGTIAAWGDGSNGSLGNGFTNQQHSPYAVTQTGPALSSKSVVAIGAGYYNGYALCSDGTISAWGINGSPYALGDGSTTDQTSPVAVNVSLGNSALYGKFVTAIAVSNSCCRALCSDGTLTSWGLNGNGQVGDNSTTRRVYPGLVNTAAGTSALYNKTVTSIASGTASSFAICSDGTVTSWGANASGQLGDNSTTQRNAPVVVDQSTLAPGERMTAVFGKADHALAIVAAPPAPEIAIEEPAATNLNDGGATIDFGAAALASAGVSKSFTIRNLGTQDLTDLAVTKSGSNSSDFVIDTTGMGSSLAPGASTTFTVTFSPSATSLRLASIQVASNDADENPFDITVRGVGSALGQLTHPGDFYTGLRAWWKLDEASGTRVDSSGTGNHLTSQNGVGSAVEDYWSSGERSADLESTSQQFLEINHASQTGLDLDGDSFTLAGWVKCESYGGGNMAVMNKGDWAPTAGYLWRIDGVGRNELVVNGTNYYGTTGSIPLNKWVHLAIVRNLSSNTLEFYVNGNLESSQSCTLAMSATTKAFRLGQYVDSTDPFDGQMKDMAVWDVPLSPLQIKSLALGVDLTTAYRPGNVSVAPTAWWKLNELSSGSSAVTRVDSAAVAHPLTDTNTVGSAGGYLEGAAADFVPANSELLSAADSTDWTIGSGDASFATWVRFNNVTAGTPYPIFGHSQDGSNFWDLFLDYGGGQHQLTLSQAVGGSFNLSLSVPWAPSAGTWYHVAWVKQGSQHRFYVDGQMLGTAQSSSTALNDFTGPVMIGRRAGHGGIFMDGRQADVAFWKGYALNAAEIKNVATALPVQKAGIVSYWPLDEASGTRSDVIGTNHLSPVNAPTTASGVAGAAASFLSSSSQLLSVSHAQQSGLDALAASTITYWAKPTATGTLQTIVSKTNGATSGYGAYQTDAGRLRLNVNSNTWALGSASVTAGAFYHGAVQYDGNLGRTFVNGALDASAAAPSIPAAASNALPFTMGAQSDSTSFFDGQIDEVVIARRWFRDEEVKALYLRGLNGLNAIPSSNADLSAITLSAGTLSPAFDAGTLSYTAGVGYRSYSLTVTPTKAQANATITVNGVPVTSGAASGSIPLSVGPNVITTVVTAQDGTTTKTYTVTVTRAAAAPGDVEEGFNAGVAIANYVLTAVTQPDGKIIIGGGFSEVGGAVHLGIARLEANGTPDASFTASANGDVHCLLMQDDGKIILGGQFTQVNGETRSRIARLNADGTLDTGFDPSANAVVLGGAMQADGKILIAGSFTTVGGIGRSYAARLNPDGSLDTSFNAGADAAVMGISQQTDGKIFAWGGFTAIGGGSRSYVARLDAVGTLDTGFVPPTLDNYVRAAQTQADGKILLGGDFTTVDGGTTRQRLLRLSASGNLDTTFTASVNGTVHGLCLQADGSFLINGVFTTASGSDRGRIARYHANGSLDTSFDPDANHVVYALALQSDGKVLAAGSFTAMSGLPRNMFARLDNTQAAGTLAATSFDRVEWLRGGTAPESQRVTFELSSNGGTNWSLLGDATRIAGGWDLSSLALPASGQIRARARIPSGYDSSSSGLVETITSYSGLSVPDIAVFNGTTLTAPNERTDNTGTQSFGTADLASVNTAQTFSIRNDGTVALSGLALSIAGTNAADFILGSLGATTLAPGASTSFSVTFSPQGFGARNAVISLASNDFDETPFEVAVSGTGGNALAASFSAANTIPLTTNGFTATSSTVNLSLGFAPSPFSTLTVVNNTSANPITGTFSNLSQGQAVTLVHNTVNYPFSADYFGGDGNDLVLVLQGPGVLDYSFNASGKVKTAIGSGNEQARAVAVQPDGKVVAVGHDGGDFVVVRYNVDGTLDSGFGTGGKVMTAIGTETDEAHGVAVQADGKIVVAGFAQTSGVRSFALVRYNTNGTLDTSFDGDGKAVSLVTGAGGEGRDVVLQSDGKIVVGGDHWSGTDTDFALLRFNTNGSLDTSFGTSGIVTTAQAGRHDEAACVALAPDGKIVLAGHYQLNTDYVIELARYQADGTLDTTFSGDGILTTQLGAAERANDVVVQPDGKIVLVGQGPGGGGNDGIVLRYNLDGTLDTSFDSDGIVGLAMGSYGDYAHGVALQWDGKILVAGITEDGVAANMMLARFLTNGTLDTSFNGTGKVSTSLGASSSDYAQGMALTPDGRIVLAGLTTVDGTWDFAVARFLVETERQANFATAAEVPFAAGSFSGAGQTVSLTLGFVPTPGQVLTLVNNTGSLPISGAFTNLADGAVISPTYNGIAYPFLASYTGGTGNDLTLTALAGALDFTFSSDGKVTTAIGGAADVPYGVAEQSDGKIVAVGLSFNGSNNDFAVLRYLADGSLDGSFGTGGKVTTAIGGGDDTAVHVSLQNDGKIVVSGWSHNGSNNDYALVRYNTNGTLDTSFNGTGKVITPIGSSDDTGGRNVIQSDGKIVVSGWSDSGGNINFALVRYNSNGSLDTSFNGTGKVTTDFSGGQDVSNGVVVQNDGKILAAGTIPGGPFGMARYNADGSLDTSFGSGGKVTTTVSGGGQGNSVALQSDGKIICAGYNNPGNAALIDFVVLRYHTDGSLDTSFDTDGQVITDVGGNTDEARKVMIQSNGKIVVAGGSLIGSSYAFSLVRHNTDGSLDTSFAGTGKVTTAIGSGSDYGTTMGLQSDGKILVVGQSHNGSNNDFALARYLVETNHEAVFASAADVPLNSNGFTASGQTVNLTLGFAPTIGTALTLVNNTGTTPISGTFTNLANGVLVPLSFGGTTYTFTAHYTAGDGNDLVLLLEGPGALDYSFGVSGKVIAGVPFSHDFIYSALTQPDGKTLVVGSGDNGSNSDFALARYHPDGSLDTSFGTMGKVLTPVGTSSDVGHSVVLQHDGRIVVGGRAYFSGTKEDFAVTRYHPDGSLDLSFGTGGIVTTAVTNESDQCEAVALQSDGKIVAAGRRWNGSNFDAVVVRYSANGSLDASFGNGGVVTTPIGSGYDEFHDVAVQGDGKIVAAGYSVQGTYNDFAVVRYLANGSLDTSFGTGGLVTTAIGSQHDAGESLRLQPDGRIVVAGSTSTGGNSDFAVVRYTSAGLLDSTFDGDGKVVTNFGGYDEGNAIALQNDGKILVTGRGEIAGKRNFAIARYHVNGTLDTSFHGDGIAWTAIGTGEDISLAVAVQVDGKIVSAGYSTQAGAYADFAVVRYLGDTTHDVTFASAANVPLTFKGLTATGQTLNLTLGFTPNPGTTLKVFDNTSLQPIAGEFVNLAQGAVVTLNYSGTDYGFVANYFGGDGNDLTLDWANTKLAAFGLNDSGQLGVSGGVAQANVPTQVVATAAIYQKTILAMSAGQAHSLVVCADGTVAAWGSNANGQLGNGSTTSASTPVAVTMGGVLNGKKVIAVAAGGQHSLALCSDGTLAAWGDGSFGQIGDNGVLDRTAPVLVSTAGALSGKRVIAISAGATHSAALCSDGTVVCWGSNTNGELGNSSNTQSSVPVAVTTSGVLLGQAVTTISCGQNHTLALLADGSVAAWGANTSKQLGNNSTSPSNVPLLVDASGLLNGKRVVEIAAGGQSSLARCSDGVLAAWGLNDRGQLGVNNATTTFGVAQAVDLSGVLSGKTITGIEMGQNHAVALCSDGSLATWGAGTGGELGNNTVSDSLVPVAVNGAILGGTDFFVSAAGGADAGHTLALIGTTTNAPMIQVELGGTALADGASQNFGNTLTSTTKSRTYVIKNTGTVTMSGVGFTLTGSAAAHYAVTTAPAASVAPGDFTSLTLAFNPTSAGPKPATLRITNNVTVNNLNPFDLPLSGVGVVTLTLAYANGTEVPATTGSVSFNATGKTITINAATLTYAPSPGTMLMVLNNTSTGFITGAFTGLAHGQLVPLTYNGTMYNFVTSYYGGTGNDVVLIWAGTRLLAWGPNSSGTLGNNSTANSSVPVPVSMAGVLSGKTIVSVAAAERHALALCADGTLAAWGANSSGQLGDNTTTDRLLPVLVNTEAGTSALAGKTVVAIAAGYDFSLALCSDGTLAAWGANFMGQLGDGTTTDRAAPVLVSGGAITGKVVTSIAVGLDFCIVTCADGTAAAWGANSVGQLGNGTTTDSIVPVAVSMGGVLNGKSISTAAAGHYHALVLCTDGTLVAWGDNTFGELGNNSTTGSELPVLVSTVGVLAGKTPISISAGQFHCMTLCTDGTLAAWGDNAQGQLGVTGNTESLIPTNITSAGVLSGKTILGSAAGQSNGMTVNHDGSVSAWGENALGQVGDGTTTARPQPVLVNASALLAGERIIRLAAGATAFNGYALVAQPVTLPGGPPVVSTNAATAVDKATVTLNGLVSPNSLATDARFEYGLDTSYGTQTAVQSLGSGSSSVNVTQNLTGLLPNTTYHYRITATNSGGTANGNDLTFKTLVDPPVAVNGTASGITNTGATLNGSVNPNTRATSAFFRVSTDPAFVTNTFTTAPQNVAAGSSFVGVSAPLSGLLFGTTYHYRLVAQNPAGEAEDMAAQSFTTTSVGMATQPPTISSTTALNLTTTSARLQGSVNPHGGLTNVFFEYGPVPGFGTNSINYSAGSGTSPQTMIHDISGLLPATQYQFRLVAENNFNNSTTTTGTTITFTTLPLPPEATTQAAAALSTTSAQLHGSVNAQNGSAVVTFEWGTDGVSFPNSLTATPSPVTGSALTPVSVELGNLLQFTTYHFRVKAVSAGGTTTGGVSTFQPAIISGLQQQFPNAPPASNGSLAVTLAPSGLLSGWRFVGEHRWRASGDTATGLVHGSRVIEFRPVPGYLQPGTDSVNVSSTGQVADYEYYATPSAGSGGILVVLKPDTLAQAALETDRGQWRLLGETTWRDSGTTASALPAGSYLVECKPVTGYSTPVLVNIAVSSGQTVNPTIVYSDAYSPTGTAPSVLSFNTVSTDATKPYGYVGQIRSNSGVGTGFAVKQRVVATAAHVVFDEGSLASVQGLQWLPQADAGGHEPLPVTPRGYYLIDGYATQRATETPGSFSLASRQKDVAALYFINDTDAARTGFAGFLASDLTNNELLVSNAQKMLVGYPVDGIATLDQGRMHATPAANLSFTGLTDRVFATTGVRSTGGNSGGPLCVQHTNGNWYPAAVYLGGATQSIVRAIDSTVIQLFDTAQQSGVDDQGYTGGGITHTGYTAGGTASTGALRINITPAGTGWRPVGSTKPYTPSGNTRSSLTPGTFFVEFTPVAGYQTPANQAVQVIAASTQVYSLTYQLNLTPQQNWRQTHFGTTANSGNAADTFDYDGDGFTNAAEYTAGTNPTMSGDFFKAENPQRSGSTFSVSTAGKAGRSYVLERSATMAAGSWTPLGTPQGPLPADAPVTLTDAASPLGAAFYHIVVTGP